MRGVRRLRQQEHRLVPSAPMLASLVWICLIGTFCELAAAQTCPLIPICHRRQPAAPGAAWPAHGS